MSTSQNGFLQRAILIQVFENKMDCALPGQEGNGSIFLVRRQIEVQCLEKWIDQHLGTDLWDICPMLQFLANIDSECAPHAVPTNNDPSWIHPIGLCSLQEVHGSTETFQSLGWVLVLRC